MRVKINCVIINKEAFIHKTYLTQLSACVYNILSEYDSIYATSLHNSKQFKRFNISRIEFGRYEHNGDVYKPLNKNIYFYVTTDDVKIIEALVNINKNNIRNIGNDLFFKINSTEIYNIEYKEKTFVLITPIVISINSREYIYPSHEDFKDMFFKNLIRKCGGNINEYDYKSFVLDIIDGYAKKKNTYNNNCSIFKFRLECPEILIKTGLEQGFGIHNTQGNGFVKEIK
jgi:CRISPR-associated endoribonuclease Cas6